MTLFSPLLRAIGQLDDPVFVGVVVRSVLWAAAGFAAMVGVAAWGAAWAVAAVLPHAPHWLAWLAGLLGILLGTGGVTLLAIWLFLPVAIGIGALFVDRVAGAVERRFHPALPPARSASLLDQARDAVGLGLRVLLLSSVALLLALLLPGVGAILGWLISGWAIGRGLFVSVAMRRMTFADAEAAYRRRRLAVLVPGCVLALAGLIPPLNLLVPVLGVAAMVHVLHDDVPPHVSARAALCR